MSDGAAWHLIESKKGRSLYRAVVGSVTLEAGNERYSGGWWQAWVGQERQIGRGHTKSATSAKSAAEEYLSCFPPSLIDFLEEHEKGRKR